MTEYDSFSSPLAARELPPNVMRPQERIAEPLSLRLAASDIEASPQNPSMDQRLFERLANTSPCLLYVYDLIERRTYYANDQILAALGLTRDAASEMGLSLFDRLSHTDDVTSVAAHQLKLMRSADGENLTIERRLRHANGEWRWFSCTETVFTRDADGTPRRIAGSAHDITARKTMEDELRAAHDELEARVAQRTAELAAANKFLQSQIAERQRDELRLRETNQLLEAVFRATSLAVYLLDADGKVLMWNPAAERMFGWTADEAVGRFLPIVPEDKMEESRALMKYVLSGRAKTNIEMRRCRKDGSTIDISAATAPLYGEDGNALTFVAIVADVTEQKRAARALAESEKKYRELFENSRGLMFTHDFDGRLLAVNPAAAAQLGYEPSELVGISIEALVAPQRRHLVAPYLHRVRERKQATGWMAFITKTGEERVWEFSNAVREEEGKQPYVIGYAHDVTARRQLEAELARARDAALESSRLKGQFLANVSHEIRTPMNGIIGMTELLLDTELDEEQREFASTIRESAQSLMTIVDDILDFSKIEAGRMRFDEEEFALRGAVERVVSLLSVRARAKGLYLTTEFSDDAPERVRGDAGRVQQVLMNLIGNAVKFTERGGVRVRVKREGAAADLRAADESAAEGAAIPASGAVRVRFEVEDSGIGIAAGERERLFEPFVQADGSTTRKYGGTGLGLAISKQLVALMGGEIGVESALAIGSTFWFTVTFAS